MKEYGTWVEYLHGPRDGEVELRVDLPAVVHFVAEDRLEYVPAPGGEFEEPTLHTYVRHQRLEDRVLYVYEP